MRYEMPRSALFESVNQEIDPRCEMLRYAVSTIGEDEARNFYFHSAHFLVERLLPVIREAGISPDTASVLDFAGGYGRFARFFRSLFEHVTVADLEPEMIEFCSRRLGVSAFLSSSDPASIRLSPHDVVFSFSLFTHLPEPIWTTWLHALWNAVRPGGLLVFSTRSTAPLGQVDQKPGAKAPRVLLGGSCLPVLSHPFQLLQERSLDIYGIRLLLDGDIGIDVDLAIFVLLRLTGICVSAESGSLRSDAAGDVTIRSTSTTIKPCSARPGSSELDVAIQLSASCSLPMVPIGRITIPLRYEVPTVSAVDLRGDPDVRILRVHPFTPKQIVFRRTNETEGRLDPEQYGATTISREFLDAAVSALPHIAAYRHFAGGEMDLFQDVTVVQKSDSGSR